jgi:hypothetical protein
MGGYDAYGDMPCYDRCDERHCRWNDHGRCRDNCTCERRLPMDDDKEEEEVEDQDE